MVDMKTVLDAGWEVGIQELIPNGLEELAGESKFLHLD